MIARDMVRMLRPGATGSPTSADSGAPEARRLAAGAEFSNGRPSCRSGSGARRRACSSSCAPTRVPVPVYRQPVSPFVEGELLEVIIEPSQFLRVRADLGKVL